MPTTSGVGAAPPQMVVSSTGFGTGGDTSSTLPTISVQAILRGGYMTVVGLVLASTKSYRNHKLSTKAPRMIALSTLKTVWQPTCRKSIPSLRLGKPELVAYEGINIYLYHIGSVLRYLKSDINNLSKTSVCRYPCGY